MEIFFIFGFAILLIFIVIVKDAYRNKRDGESNYYKTSYNPRASEDFKKQLQHDEEDFDDFMNWKINSNG